MTHSYVRPDLFIYVTWLIHMCEVTNAALVYSWVSSVLQCVAVCCSVLQCVAVCCSVLQLCCSVLQCVARDRWAHICCFVEFVIDGEKEGVREKERDTHRDTATHACTRKWMGRVYVVLKFACTCVCRGVSMCVSVFFSHSLFHNIHMRVTTYTWLGSNQWVMVLHILHHTKLIYDTLLCMLWLCWNQWVMVLHILHYTKLIYDTLATTTTKLICILIQRSFNAVHMLLYTKLIY